MLANAIGTYVRPRWFQRRLSLPAGRSASPPRSTKMVPSMCSISCAGAGTSRSCSVRSEERRVPPAEGHPHRRPRLGHRLATDPEAAGISGEGHQAQGRQGRVHACPHRHLGGREGAAEKRCPLADELRSEVLAFPYGKHDDQVDALSQLMTWAEERRIPKHSIQRLRWIA
jgi:hypothetical protein